MARSNFSDLPSSHPLWVTVVLLFLATASCQKITLPKDPAVACSPAVQRKATRCPARYDVYVQQDDFSEEDQKDCCVLLASYFGPNATAGAGASANCFCDATVWAETLEREKKSYLTYATYFDTCTGLGLPVYYYKDGAGPCNASAAAASAPAPAPVVEPHVRSYGAWMRSLDSNPVLIAAFIVTIPSVIGFTTVVIWPFTFFAALEVSRWVQMARVHLYHKKMVERSAR